MRTIVYTLPDHKEETFELDTYEVEKAERQVAEFALNHGDVLGYRFEGQFDDTDEEVKRICVGY